MYCKKRGYVLDTVDNIIVEELYYLFFSMETILESTLAIKIRKRIWGEKKLKELFVGKGGWLNVKPISVGHELMPFYQPKNCTVTETSYFWLMIAFS